MRHTAHELADRGELARLQELLLRRLDLADTRGELGVEAGVLERQGRVVGEGLGQVDFLHRELPSHRIADLEHPDDRVAHDQWHRTDRADARLDDALPQVRRHVDPRLGQHVIRRDGPAQRDGPAIGARPRRHERPGGEARLKRAAGPDGDERAGRGIEAEERGGLSPEQMRDAVDGALGHLGGIEGARQLPPQRGQRGRPLRLAERGLAAALLGDVALDALDERDERRRAYEQAAAPRPRRITVETIPPSPTPARCCRRISKKAANVAVRRMSRFSRESAARMTSRT